MTDRIKEFLARNREDGPRLVVDLDVVRENYLGFASALPDTRVFYALKANPAPEILSLLAGLGSCFDAASIAEIEQALAAGATPDRISFGNTIKKEKDIARATRSASGFTPSTARPRSRRSRAPRPARKCSAAFSATGRARNGRSRASSAARRRWRRACSNGRMRSASSRTGSPFTSARSSAIRACGTAR